MSGRCDLTLEEVDAALKVSTPIRPRPAPRESENGVHKSEGEPPRPRAAEVAAVAPRDSTRQEAPHLPPAAWPHPIDLSESVAAPPFPIDALSPAVARNFIAAVALGYSVPIDLPALVWLALASGCVASIDGARVLVEAQAGWRETPNLYAAVALPSGARKSAVFEALIAPVREHEGRVAAAARPEIARAKSDRAVKAARLKQLQENAAKGKGAHEWSREAEDLAAELATRREPVEPRLLCEDASTEKLVNLLAQHGQMILASPECDVIGSFKGRYSDKGGPNLSVFLKAYSGEELIVDRIGRASERVASPLLSILICGQPEALASLVADSLLRDRGLVYRFLFAAPPSPLGNRPLRPPPVSQVLREEYGRMMSAALERGNAPPIPPESESEEGSGGIGGGVPPRVLAVDPDAAEALDAFRAEIEPTMLEGGDFHHASGWASKAPGFVVRIAAVMTLIGNPDSDTIDAETMTRAATIGRWAVAHAKRVFSSSDADADTAIARRLLAWLRRRGLSHFSVREAYQALKGPDGSAISRAEDLDGALNVLQETGWIAPVDPPPRQAGKGGRAPSPRFNVHPKACGQDGEAPPPEPPPAPPVQGPTSVSGARGHSKAQSDRKVG